MTISELQAHLARVQTESGDLEVRFAADVIDDDEDLGDTVRVAGVATALDENEKPEYVLICDENTLDAFPIPMMRPTMPEQVTPYRVRCHDRCGFVYLSEAEYDRQMMSPDSLWKCPKCRSSATWDDAHYEKSTEDRYA